MEEILKPEILEAIITNASVGQFGQQIVEETFNETFKDMSTAKLQIVNALISGGASLSTYFITSDTFVAKTALLVLLSGIFATTALKMLRYKNQKSNKLENISKKLDDNAKDREIEELKRQLSEK